MIELVFVIVVLGILAALSMPRLDRDIEQETKDSILSAIRYTQHLALTDNKHRFDEPDWQKALWQIHFEDNGATGGWSYAIASNMGLDNSLDANESATDPANGQLFHYNAINASPNIFIEKLYGIDDISFNGCSGTSNSSAKHIAFDNLGRLHRGVTQGATYDYATYVKGGDCQITFSASSFDNNFTIKIKQETGYAYILGQPNS